MSKIAGLPQMKVGWIAVFGGESDSGIALSRLEVIGDTFLSMNAPAQLALPRWLDGRRQIQKQILERAITNLQEIKMENVGLLRTDAGWSAVIRLPKVGIGAENLLEHEGIVVHPGSFYGITGDETIVLSLIGPQKEFARGISRIAAVVAS
jgi:aspartate/methionine/tyrosine aminotransferase